MNEEKALEILEGMEIEGGDHYVMNNGGWIDFYKGSGDATLDGSFSVKELEAVIFMIKENV